jgi:hypothetical protein
LLPAEGALAIPLKVFDKGMRVAERKTKQKHGLQSEILSFGELLSGALFFVMPYLQRPYQWTDAEVSDLVNDFLAARSANYRNYVLGTIIGLRGPNKDIEIVDGQQRLITICILLAYCRDRLAGRNSAFDAEIQACILAEGRPRVTPRPVDAPLLRDLFQARDSGPRLAAAIAVQREKEKERLKAKEAPRTEDPQELMIAAAVTVRDKLDRLGLDAVQKLAEFIMDQGIIDFIIADDRTQAAVLYRSMNMRGRELSPADLIKLEAIEHGGLDRATKDKAARVWEETENKLGRERFELLLEMMPLLMSRDATRTPGDLAEWREHTFRNARPDVVLLTMLPLYANVMMELERGEIDAECADAAEERALDETNDLLKGLLHLHDTYWMPAAMNVVHTQRQNPLFLLRYFQGLERLSYAFFLGAMRKDDRADRAARFARVVAAGVDETLLAAAFELQDDEQAALAKRVREPFGRDNWKRRAIATRINALLPRGRNFLRNEDVSVEHVLPTSASAPWEALGWPRAIAKYCSETVGNFVLVTEAQNNKAGQKLLAPKKQIYFEWPGGAPIHAITEDIRDVNDWNEAYVRERTERFARLLLAYWKVKG